MFTRRGLINGALGVGAGLAFMGARPAAAQANAAQIARNKAVIQRFKDVMGTKEEDAVMREIAPTIKRVRVGMENLNVNARDQGFPSAGPGLRNAFPDRNDMIEDMIAEGDMVAMKYRSRGTHAWTMAEIAKPRTSAHQTAQAMSTAFHRPSPTLARTSATRR
jgi:hypothetical protein